MRRIRPQRTQDTTIFSHGNAPKSMSTVSKNVLFWFDVVVWNMVVSRRGFVGALWSRNVLYCVPAVLKCFCMSLPCYFTVVVFVRVDCWLDAHSLFV